MKPTAYIILTLALICTATISSSAQTVTKKPTQKKTSTSKPKTVAATVPEPGKEVTITLTNEGRGAVPVFAGNRIDVRNPKLQSVGGLSKNTLYLRVNDVVCIMTPEKKMVACAEIKPSTVKLSINSSATEIK